MPKLIIKTDKDVEFEVKVTATEMSGRSLSISTLDKINAVWREATILETPVTQPCPFCGTNFDGKTHHIKNQIGSRNQQLECPQCGAEGPRHSDPISAWNRRS